MMHGRRKSDSAIVAVKPANNAERSAAEPVEPRAGTKGNAGQQSTRRTQSRISVSKMLARIRQIVAVDTRGRSRMRESCMYGSVRGARGDSRPYRDRREFITLLGGAAAGWPLTAIAQRSPDGRRIGVLANEPWPPLEGLRDGMRALGYIDERGLHFEYRFAEGRAERYPALAAELVRLPADAIVAWGTPASLAAKQATGTVPVVMISGDPIAVGLVPGLAHPGANVTGLSTLAADLEGKRIDLLKELLANLARVAVLSNPTDPFCIVAVD